MDFPYAYDLSYTVAGLVVGLIVGLTGIGGGALMTPVLVLGFGISPLVAVGTDLAYAAITKSTGVWVHWRRGFVEWRIMGTMALGSLPAAVITLLLLGQSGGHPKVSEALITTALSVALVLTALVLLSKDQLQRIHELPRLASVRLWIRQRRLAFTVAGGVGIGILVTLSSVGAGALGTAMLVLLYPGLRGSAIIGTDLAHAVPLAAVAGLGHASIGSVDTTLLVNLLLGSLPGVYLGSRLGIFLPEKILRPVLAVMLMYAGFRLL